MKKYAFEKFQIWSSFTNYEDLFHCSLNLPTFFTGVWRFLMIIVRGWCVCPKISNRFVIYLRSYRQFQCPMVAWTHFLKACLGNLDRFFGFGQGFFFLSTLIVSGPDNLSIHGVSCKYPRDHHPSVSGTHVSASRHRNKCRLGRSQLSIWVPAVLMWVSSVRKACGRTNV